MLDSIAPRSPLTDGAAPEAASPGLSATEWWMESEVRRLHSELARTRAELEILRSTTAQVVTAILGTLQSQETPVAAVPSEIQELATLTAPSEREESDGPLTGEHEAIDVTNQESLAYLDRRFRWVRSRRSR